MTNEIRNILDPSSTFSDEDVSRLLAHAQKKKNRVWETVMFFRRHNQVQLATDWLREQGDRKLCQLADVLPRLFEVLDRQGTEELTPTSVYNIQSVGQLNPSASDINNHYGRLTNPPIIPLTPNPNNRK